MITKLHLPNSTDWQDEIKQSYRTNDSIDAFAHTNGKWLVRCQAINLELQGHAENLIRAKAEADTALWQLWLAGATKHVILRIRDKPVED